MERVIFVEVLDRRGEVLRRERVGSLPARIGRAYDNDVILDDPHVCPAHAVLEDDGAGGPLRLRDLGSLNGLVEWPGRERAGVVALAPGTTVQLGRTLLRVRDSAQPVPAAVAIPRGPRLVEWSLDHWTAAFAWIALVLAFGAWQSTREATMDVNWKAIGTAQGGVLLALLAWAGAWALVTRLMTHHARFVAHLAITVLAVLASGLQERAFGLAQFLLAPVEPVQVANQAATAVVIAAAIFAHLGVLGAGRASRRALAAAGLGAAVLVLGLGRDFADEPDWMVTLPYWSRLEPLPLAWLPIESPEAFFRETQGLEAELGALQDEPAEEATDDPPDDDSD